MPPRARAIASFGLVLAMGLALSACAPSKSYRFPLVRIDATVEQNGSLSIVEQRTFAFHGQFHFAFFTVEHQTFDDVKDFSVSENNEPYTPDGAQEPGHVTLEDPVLEGPGGFKYKATWYFDAKDQDRTFTIRYHVLCAVTPYTDTAHLLWKFIGEGWTVPTDRALITIHLPGAATDVPDRPTLCQPGIPAEIGGVPEEFTALLPTRALSADEVRAWGHGPLQGHVDLVNPQTIVLTVSDLLPGAFVEGSVLFPMAAVPYLDVGSHAGFDRILTDERRMADEANALRRAANARAARERRWTPVAWIFLADIPLLALILILVARRRDSVPDVPRILDQPPDEDEAPAALAVAWARVHRRSGSKAAFRAQLLDLVSKHAVELVPKGSVTGSKDYELQLRQSPGDDLGRLFATYLFGDAEPGAGAKPVDLNALAGSQLRREDLVTWWDAVGERVRPVLDGSGARPETAILGWLFLLSPGLGILLTWLSTLRGARYTLGLVAATWAASIVARHLVPRRLKPDQLPWLAKWTAFRRYLKRFASVAESPAAGIVVWERYLVLAVALRCARRVQRQLKAVVPADQLEALSAGSSSILQPFVFQSIASASVPSPTVSFSSGGSSSSDFSSSSGFDSGGFSSGGGGGGGGTGGGAG